MKGRHSPYPRPFIPTPSSPSVPSEGEFEGMRECDPYSIQEEKVIQCANPMDLTRQETPETTLKQEATVVEDTFTKEEEEQLQEAHHDQETHREQVSAENEDTLPENDHSLDYDNHGISVQEMPLDHEEEPDTPHLSIPEEIASPEKPQLQLKLVFDHSAQETESRPIEPLKYGDLVVVDYAEKKKVHKWPALVTPPGTFTNLI